MVRSLGHVYIMYFLPPYTWRVRYIYIYIYIIFHTPRWENKNNKSSMIIDLIIYIVLITLLDQGLI